MSDVINVGTTPNDGTGDSLRAAMQKINLEMARHFSVCHPPGNAVCDYGVTDDTAAFQAAVNACTSGTTTIHVPRTAKITGTVTASTGTVVWDFAPGAGITGGGTLPFHSSTPAYNASPTTGKRIQVWHGTSANPVTDTDLVPTIYAQRVDAGVTADDSAHLISNIYSTFVRKPTGRGWLYGTYSYLEDQSNATTAESVAVAGSAHSTDKAAVWALYGEAHARSTSATATGLELDASNHTASDFSYSAADPLAVAHTKGAWIFSTGSKKNTLALGIGSQSKYDGSNVVTKSWRAGIFMQTWSITDVGIDIQAQPATLIHFKYGASTDGTGNTVGGIGLDCGASAAYGTGTHEGAIHLRDHRLVYGTNGNAYLHYNTGTGTLEFVYGSTVVGNIDSARGFNATMNGKPAPGTVTAATYSVGTTDANLIFNRAGTVTVTLPAAASFAGRELLLRTITANTVVSASSNVVPAAGGAAGTAILAATAGKWALLQSDGTNWQIMTSN